jgi:alanine racemase
VTEPSTELRSRAWVEVDLAALCANADRLLASAGHGASLLPMVKADAYGLGAERVARVLAWAFRGRIAGFGVAAVAEGEALRSAGWTGRLVVFTPLSPADYDRAARAGLTVCVSSLEALTAWAQAAADAGRVLAFHTEVDTGMGRSGFPAGDLDSWLAEVVKLSSRWLQWEGCFTHFHSADELDLRPTSEQWSRFRAAVELIRMNASPSPGVLHVANSAAALRCEFPGDWVRPGIFLYGGRVGAEPPSPVVSVRARVVLIRRVAVGTTLGYGATYRARREQECWGTLAIGYGDGIPRAVAPAGGEVLVGGRRVPMIGRISMDMIVVDLTDVPNVAIGDAATLIGRDGEEEITIDSVARRAGTISYEILTGLSPRLPRIYLGAAEHLRESGFPS